MRAHPEDVVEQGRLERDARETVSLEQQLNCALDFGAVFCIHCGQPDEPHLHDRARCTEGKVDEVSVARAVEIYDESCAQEPDLDGDARALHCIIVALTGVVQAPA